MELFRNVAWEFSLGPFNHLVYGTTQLSAEGGGSSSPGFYNVCTIRPVIMTGEWGTVSFLPSLDIPYLYLSLITRLKLSVGNIGLIKQRL